LQVDGFGNFNTLLPTLTTIFSAKRN